MGGEQGRKAAGGWYSRAGQGIRKCEGGQGRAAQGRAAEGVRQGSEGWGGVWGRAREAKWSSRKGARPAERGQEGSRCGGMGNSCEAGQGGRGSG
jgi:hypothetical protein